MGVLKQAMMLNPWLTHLRHELHMWPEVGMDLPMSTSIVVRELEAMGIAYERILFSGIRATIGSGKKCILLRADMDALPIQEETDLLFASQNQGVMHACGHDMHTAMLLGAAKLLKDKENQLKGQVVLMFQPGEEGYLGAKHMIDAGLLDPLPDHAVALHMAPMRDVDSGAIAMMPGIILASNDNIEIVVRGKGGHASEPHLSQNPITVSFDIVREMERVVDDLSSDIRRVFAIGEIHAGSAPNIIPETCVLRGTLRLMNEERRRALLETLSQTVQDVARCKQAEASFKLTSSLPLTINDPGFTEKVHGWLTEHLRGALIAPFADYSSMGSEDFSFLAERIPSSYLYIVSKSPPGKDVGLHSPYVIFDDAALPYGVATFVQIALSYLDAHSID